MATLTHPNDSLVENRTSTSESLHPLHVFNLIQAGWFKLIFFTIACWLAAGAYYVITPATYQSTTQLYVIAKDPALATRGQTAGKTDANVSDDLLATQMQIITSRLILKKVTERKVKLGPTLRDYLVTASQIHAQQVNGQQVDPVAVSGDKRLQPSVLSHWVGLLEAGGSDPALEVWQKAARQEAKQTTPSGAEAPVSPELENAINAICAQGVLLGAELQGLEQSDRSRQHGVVSNQTAQPELSEPLQPLYQTLVGMIGGSQTAETQQQLIAMLDDGNLTIGELPSIHQGAKGQNPIDYLISNLAVSRGGTGGARDAHSLNISLTHTSARDSKIVLDALLAEYREYLKEKFQDVNKDAAVLISQAREELLQELTEAEDEYRVFRESAPILWSGDQSHNVHSLRYEGIQDEISSLNLLISETESRLKIVAGALEKDLANGNAPSFDRLALIDEKNAQRMGMMLGAVQNKAESAEFQALMPQRSASANSEYTNLMSLMLKEKTLTEQFNLGPKHPEIVSLREQIQATNLFLKERSADLEKNVTDLTTIGPEQILDAYLKLLRNDIDTLNERKSELEKQAAIEEQAAKTMISYEMDGEALVKRIGRQQTLYDTVVDRLRDINIAREYGGVVTDVLADPEIGRSIWPKLPICLLIGTVLGLFAGGGVTAASEMRNRMFRSADEVKDSLKAPVLTHLPNLNPKGDTKLAARIRQTNSVIHPTIYVHHLPKSVNAEVFRALRTSILFKRERGQSVFCVTSSNQGDGKSTLTINLATSIANSGKRVLVIDCDMRRSSIHALLGLENKKGLTNLINEDTEPADLIHETEIVNLFALTAGQVPANPSELLGSDRFRELVSLFRDRYDFVFVDCPPVLAVTDPAIVSTIVDGTILLVNVGKDKRPEAIHAKQILDDVGAKVLGLVVSGEGLNSASRYAGGYGYGRYGYRYGRKGNQSYYSSDTVEKIDVNDPE
jgi:capsular exopolysaccharide synthesis family protein